MQRIVVNRGATLQKDFSFTPTGTPTVTVTRSDGSPVTVGNVQATADPTVFEYTIPASSNTLLDTYTETWTATAGGEDQLFVDTIEVAGGVLCTIAELKTLFSTATTSELATIRMIVEQRLENACSRAFVPRYALETFNGDGSVGLWLKPDLRVIRTVTVSGVAYTAGQIAGLALSPTGLVTNTLGAWPAGYSNITVGYEHGCAVPPPDISRAALLAAKETYGATGDGRVVRREADGQAVTYASPSSASGFSDPVLRSIIRDHDLSVGVA